MDSESDPAIQELTRLLRNSFDPCTIYLFGSRATNQSRSDSDFDVLVIVHQSEETPFARFKRARHALRDFQHSVDVLVYTKSEWDDLSTKRFSIARQVKDRGVVLHAA